MDHEQYHAAERAFIDGFRAASDKQGFLALARIPHQLPDGDGPSLKLVEVILADSFEVGRASPGFASRELVYHPLPGKLVSSRTRLSFRYVSLAHMRELSLAEVLERSGVALSLADGHHHHHAGAAHAHGHGHRHG
jgi:hypothetical protein